MVMEGRHCRPRPSDDDRRRIGMGIRLRQFAAEAEGLAGNRRPLGTQRWGRDAVLVSVAGAFSIVCQWARKRQPLLQDRAEGAASGGGSAQTGVITSGWSG